MRSTLILILLMATAGCSDFDPRSLLNAPRVVGVVAEPPEVGPGGSVRLTSIEYGEEIESRTWSLCLISLGVFVDFACLDEALEIVLPSDEASIDISFTEEDVDLFALLSSFIAEQGLEEAMAGCGAACVGPDGERRPYFDVQIKLDTRWSDGTEMTTYKSVRVRFDEVELNTNPDISDLLVDGLESPEPVAPGDTVRLTVSNDSSLLQRYEDGGGRTYDEELTLTWYSTAGEFASAVTFGEDLDAVLRLPSELIDDDIQVLVVARDGRGGTDYLSTVIPVVR